MSELPELPEPDALIYLSTGGASRAPRRVVAGQHAPPTAEPYYSAEQMRAYGELCRAPVKASEARGDVEAEARRLFELNSAGWRSFTPWDQLHAETRELWLDKARRRLSAHTQAGPVADVYDAMGERLKEPNRQR